MLRFYLVVLVIVIVIVIVIEDIEDTTTCQHKKSIEKRQRLVDSMYIVFLVNYDYDDEHEHDDEHDPRREILDFSTSGSVCSAPALACRDIGVIQCPRRVQGS